MILAISENLKNLRLSRGLSHGQMAKTIGISKSMIGHYENGSRQPSYDTMIRIADYFDVSVDYLLGRTNTNTPNFAEGLTDLQKEVVFAAISEFRKANQRNA